MISRILSPSRVFKARSFANQCIRNGTRYVAKNGTRALTTVQYSNYNRVQYYQVPQISRCFSLTSEGDQLPFQESISTVTSFENAVNLISECQQRSFEDNLLVLKALGRFSSGTILIRQHPLFNLVDDFVRFLDAYVCNSKETRELDMELVTRGIWAISRLGYTPSTKYPTHLLTYLYSEVMNHVTSLTPPTISLLLRSMGKMRFAFSKSHISKLLQAIHALKEEFTLMETVDVLWGLARLRYATPALWRSFEIEEGAQCIKDLYQYTEDYIIHHPDALNVLRPGNIANLVFSFTFVQYPNAKDLLDALTTPVCQVIPKCTPLEISILYRAFVETGVIKPELNRAVKKYLTLRNEELNGSTSLSLLYSYSRGIHNKLFRLDRELVLSLFDTVFDSIEDYSYADLTYLIGAYENLKLYPEKNTDFICDQILPHLDKLSSIQHFHLINFIIHSRTTSSASASVIQTLLQRYTASNSPSSIANTGIRCALLRYASVTHTSSSALVTYLEKDFLQHPDSFNSRCICQLLFDTCKDCPLKETTLIQLIKRFAGLCGDKGKVTKDDIIFTISSMIPYYKKYNSYILPITLSLGVSSWCLENQSLVTSKVISEALFGFAKMGVTPTALLNLFESKFENKLDQFQDNELMNVLKSFAIFSYSNTHFINSIYDQLSLLVSTLDNSNVLSFLWCVTKLTPERKELLQRIQSEIGRRNLNEKEQKNYNNLKELIQE